MALFSFKLSDWQEKAVNSIKDGGHCLVTAPTGSGKTVPAEFAIDHFNSKGKKVIYTSPIKALSNQKYYEFQKKFPEVTFGILTGDIKDNPEADVLIMTTEILCNHLHNMKHPDSQLDFNIDIESELGCVVFDEVHYINDADRGTVWEECFMLLPEHIQLVMLSATIATPEKFIEWIESIHPESEKKVALCSTIKRSVPLTHYLWLTAIDSAFNSKNKNIVSLMEKHCNKPVQLYSKKDGFDDNSYKEINDIHYHLQSNHHIKRQHVLNNVVKYLKENEKLPAICFVYSRKNVERFAKELTQTLNDSTTMNKVAQECRSIISKFPNAKEYIALDEYSTIVKLVEKGIGIHHSGILPVFREMIELLFDRGYIKFLFATETFAVGLNMPTKTVLFTSLKKFDGNSHRYLLPHEYTQQAGRAGRRGYDTVGHVIHLSNLFEMPLSSEYKVMLGNVPPKIVSKLKISYPIVMNCENPIEFIKKSAIHHEILKEVNYYNKEMKEKSERMERLENFMENSLRTPIEKLNQIAQLEETISFYRNKQRKQKDRELAALYDEYRHAREELKHLDEYNKCRNGVTELEKDIENTNNYVKNQVEAINRILVENNFLDERANIARNIKESHPLVMTDVFEKFELCDAVDLVAFFSCFTNINVGDEHKISRPRCDSIRALQLIEMAVERLDYYYDQECKQDIYSGEDYHIHFDLTDEAIQWCDCKTEEQCESFLTKLQKNKGIFIGEFVKAMLKVNAIAKEFEKICQGQGNSYTSVLHTLSQIGELTLKSVCTSQSLYV